MNVVINDVSRVENRHLLSDSYWQKFATCYDDSCIEHKCCSLNHTSRLLFLMKTKYQTMKHFSNKFPYKQSMFIHLWCVYFSLVHEYCVSNSLYANVKINCAKTIEITHGGLSLNIWVIIDWRQYISVTFFKWKLKNSKGTYTFFVLFLRFNLNLGSKFTAYNSQILVPHYKVCSTSELQ